MTWYRSLVAFFFVTLCLTFLMADAFNFHRKLSQNSPIRDKLNQRVDKRVHNLSLLRLGGKLFRTEQPQVKRLMPDVTSLDTHFELADPRKTPLLWFLMKEQESQNY